MPTTEKMLTLEQRTALLAAVASFIAVTAAEAEEYIHAAYAAGRQGTADVLAYDIVISGTDASRAANLLQSNLDLIKSVSDKWLADVQDIVSEGYLNGWTDLQVTDRLGSVFGNMRGNWSVIARDQIAKACYVGRNQTYREARVEMVEIVVSDGACDECTPYEGLKVPVDDDDSRPQYHIQCACTDVPVDPQDERTQSSDPEEVQSAQETAAEGGDRNADR